MRKYLACGALVVVLAQGSSVSAVGPPPQPQPVKVFYVTYEDGRTTELRAPKSWRLRELQRGVATFVAGKGRRVKAKLFDVEGVAS